MANDLIVEVRDARSDDREAVIAFCARTWGDDGDDYIPGVWDAWLADTAGALLVGVLAGQPVAISRVVMLSADEAWIEGLRVAPHVRRQGVGRVIISRSLVRAREMGAATVRMFTGAANVASQGLFSRFGFTRVAELAWYTGAALDDSPAATTARSTAELEPSIGETSQDTTVGALPPGARLLTPGHAEFERLWAWLEQSNLTPFNGGIEIHHWDGRAVSEPSLRAYLAAGEVIELQEWGAAQALAIVSEDRADGAELEVRYIDGLSDAIGRLALLLRGEAHRRGLEQVWLWLPDLLILRDAMDGAGYVRGEPEPMWVYAREL